MALFLSVPAWAAQESPAPVEASSSPSPASTTSAPSATPPVIAVRLFGGSATRFVLCANAANCNVSSASASEADALAAITERASQFGVRTVVLFLAGYSTSYAQGLAEAQHIARQFGPPYLVVFVDWGSRGAHVDYESDAHSAQRNAPALAALMSALAVSLGNVSLSAFAHSMGTRVVVGAIAAVQLASGGAPVVDEAVLAAPDMSIDDYRKAITRKPQPFGRVTIYVSRHDHALLLSALIHLHHRLGQTLPGRISLADTVVVDASAADRMDSGHGYAIHDPHVLLDIAQSLLGASIPHAAWKCVSGNLWALVPKLVALEGNDAAAPSPSPAPDCTSPYTLKAS